eukprot:971509-Amorphochlora_amoeboformis.AAC.1
MGTATAWVQQLHWYYKLTVLQAGLGWVLRVDRVTCRNITLCHEPPLLPDETIYKNPRISSYL